MINEGFVEEIQSRCIRLMKAMSYQDYDRVALGLASLALFLSKDRARRDMQREAADPDRYDLSTLFDKQPFLALEYSQPIEPALSMSLPVPAKAPQSQAAAMRLISQQCKASSFTQMESSRRLLEQSRQMLTRSAVRLQGETPLLKQRPPLPEGVERVESAENTESPS